ncbi:di-/tripeptide transporter, partial [Acrasis kona]
MAHRFIGSEDESNMLESRLRRQREEDLRSQTSNVDRFHKLSRGTSHHDNDDTINEDLQQDDTQIELEPFLLFRGTEEQQEEDRISVLLFIGILVPPVWVWCYFKSRSSTSEKARRLGKISLGLFLSFLLVFSLLIFMMLFLKGTNKR